MIFAGDRMIHVLCGAAHPPSRARFEAEARVLGRKLAWLDPHAIERVGSELAYDGVALDLPEVALARTGGLTTDRALDAMRAYEELGTTVVDSAEAVERCRDKLATHAFLAAAALPVPLTVALGTVEAAVSSEAAIDLLGLPMVVKPVRGMKGGGVRLVTGRDDLERAARTDEPLLAQEYVPHAHDVRAIVVGGECLGAIGRTAGADFRCNLAVGGRAEAIELPDAALRLAVGAAAALGAEVAGVDMLPGDDGWRVLEVNASPGFQGFEAVTCLNVARAILEHALALA